MKNRKPLALAALIVSALAIAPISRAVTYSFVEITNNSGINVAGQLSMDVTDVGGLASFKFLNNVGLPSSITDVYFQATFTPPPQIFQSAGVSFGTPATPGDLPGGGAVGFVTTGALSADSNSPAVSDNGINSASEWLDLRFGYGSYTNLAGVLSAIDAGTLRVGLHVQALSDGQSEGYVNNGPSDVPGVPEGGSAVALLGLAMGTLALVRRYLS